MQQYQRKIEILIGDKTTGLLVQDLKIQFEVNKGLDKEPNKAVVKIYNLPRNELKALEAKFTEVLINAGYVGHVGSIFRGEITFWKSYKQDNDLITEITAEDGAKKYLHGKTNITFDKNTSDEEIIKNISGGTTHVSKVKSTQRVRGKVISSPTRDILSKMAEKHDCDWSYQDGKIIFLAKSDTLNNEIVVLSYNSGLLTEPEQTETGITVKCLLNPNIKIGSKLQLVNTTVIPYHSENKEQKKRSNKKHKDNNNSVNHDGVYKVAKCKYVGDNYSTGSDFTCTIELISL